MYQSKHQAQSTRDIWGDEVETPSHSSSTPRMKLGALGTATTTSSSATQLNSFKTKRIEQKVKQHQQQQQRSNLDIFKSTPDDNRKSDLKSIFEGGGTISGVSSKSNNRTNQLPTAVQNLLNPANKSTRKSTHIVCAISENLARDTCIASVDALSPTELTVLKFANSLTYAETIMALDLLGPDECLLSESRRAAPLSVKIHSFFENKTNQQNSADEVVVKFIPR